MGETPTLPLLPTLPHSRTEQPMSRTATPRESHLTPFTNRLARLPYWLLAAILLGVIFLWVMVSRESYEVILKAVAQGRLGDGLRHVDRVYAGNGGWAGGRADAGIGQPGGQRSVIVLRGNPSRRADAGDPLLHRVRRCAGSRQRRQCRWQDG